MPSIEIQTNVKVEETVAQTVKSCLGEIITYLPGKSESGLMVVLEDESKMWFHGENDLPMAIVEVKIFGEKVDKEGSNKMTGAVCELLQKELGLDPKNIYVCYMALPHWGCNGRNF